MAAVNDAAKIARLCAEAGELGTLDLSNCNIKQLPMAVYMLTKSGAADIKRVDLSNNHLKTIPDKVFSHFHAAEEIVLAGNELSQETRERLANCFETERTKIAFE